MKMKIVCEVELLVSQLWVFLQAFGEVFGTMSYSDFAGFAIRPVKSYRYDDRALSGAGVIVEVELLDEEELRNFEQFLKLFANCKIPSKTPYCFAPREGAHWGKNSRLFFRSNGKFEILLWPGERVCADCLRPFYSPESNICPSCHEPFESV
jgi:hypothetical protein